ncbi:MAG: NAD(P)H-dependent glycerol-3-phosphate dehydrogenase [Pseudomonadota bacterium]
MTRVAVIGSGAFGTALATVLARGGLPVTLWGRDQTQLAAMASEGENRRYLPGIALPEALQFGPWTDADLILLALPAQQLRGFLAVNPLTAPVITLSKGIDLTTGALPHDLAGAAAVISGPGFAAELATGRPTALSLASRDAELGARMQETLSTGALRLYLTDDMTGVGLGGALKNVYAIACGMAVGAGLGESARAALMTRGFAEMQRLGAALGAAPETLTGLSGLGDLALSCTSDRSRNFAHGQRLGATQNTRGGTVEGIATAQALLSLAPGLDLPIARAVADVLEARTDVAGALRALMSRPLKREDD